MNAQPFVVVVDSKVRTRHATAMDAEVEAGLLRSFGWRAYAAREVKRERQLRARAVS